MIDLKESLKSIQEIQYFLKNQVDAFVTEEGGIRFGVPVDLSASPQVSSLIEQVDAVIRKFKLKTYHADANPHISVGSCAAKMRNRFEWQGPVGSQYSPAVVQLPASVCDVACTASGIELKVGSITEIIKLDE